MERYYVGETARLRMSFTDEAGIAAAPPGLSVQALSPSGAVVTGAATAEDTGIYYCDLPVTAPGAWTAQWSWIGPAPSLAVQRFLAVPTGLP